MQIGFTGGMFETLRPLSRCTPPGSRTWATLRLVRPIPLLGCTDRHQYSHELPVGPVCDANWVYRRPVREAAASQSLHCSGFKNLPTQRYWFVNPFPDTNLWIPIDSSLSPPDNSGMSVDITPTLDEDLKAVNDAFQAGRPVPAHVNTRLEERAANACSSSKAPSTSLFLT